MPNGKKFHYANAQFEMRDNTWGKRPTVTYWAIKDHHWRKVIAWHGHLTENVVQALASELLVAAMFRFEERGFPVVLTVHDEIVVEHPDITAAMVEEIMSESPEWAIDIGLPVAVEAWVGKRYRK
jgi:DNA polymerase